MTGEISFFELGVADAEQAHAFYSGLFGWSFAPGPDGGHVITTPGVPGGLHSGDPGASPYLFFAVDDMETALARVLQLGGTVEGGDLGAERESASRFGRFRLCRDDQGSAFGLHQPPPAG